MKFIFTIIQMIILITKHFHLNRKFQHVAKRQISTYFFENYLFIIITFDVN